MITNLMNGLLEKLFKGMKGIDTFETVVNWLIVAAVIFVTLCKTGTFD